MILGMTNCTNCAKYKLLLTWSTFHFRGSKRPSIFICAKTKTWLKIWLLTWIPQIKHSTLSLLNKRGSYTQCCQRYINGTLQNSHFRMREVYINKTNHLEPARLPTPNFLFILFFLTVLVLNHPDHHLNCIFLFKETYCFHLLPLYSHGEWVEYKKLDFK